MPESLRPHSDLRSFTYIFHLPNLQNIYIPKMPGDTEYYLPSSDQLRKLNTLRNNAIEPAYESYLENPPAQPACALPSLELVHSSDLGVKISRDEVTGRVAHVSIQKTSDPSAVNFMGFHRNEDCLAFKGEARLFDQFVEFASDVVRTGIEGAFRAPTEIRIPEAGLQSGLTYAEFAARVEVVEYVMWSVPDSDSDEDIQLPKLQPLLVSTSSSPAPNINYAAIDSSEGAIVEPNTHGSDASIAMAHAQSPSSGSSSSLSPPPEEIVMPASLKEYWAGINAEIAPREQKQPEPERKKKALRKRRAGQ